jgi:uncharacterized protein YndB with AHSA1/START domain
MSRSQEVIIEIKATPEEVFRAVTEPEGIVKWFGPEARVDPRVGGEYCVSWGPGMEIKSTISAYDPFTHFGGYRERSTAYGPGGKQVETGVARKIAVDYYIEAIGDGMTRLRLVQSGFGPEAAWDDEISSITKGWAEFLGKLKEVLER